MRVRKAKRFGGLLLGAVAAAGAMFGGSTILGIAPWSHADDTSFYTKVQTAGIPGPEAAAVYNGHLTCVYLQAYKPPSWVVYTISKYAGLTFGQSLLFTGLAVGEFCPQYLGVATPVPAPVPHQPPPTAVQKPRIPMGEQVV